MIMDEVISKDDDSGLQAQIARLEAERDQQQGYADENRRSLWRAQNQITELEKELENWRSGTWRYHDVGVK